MLGGFQAPRRCVLGDLRPPMAVDFCPLLNAKLAFILLDADFSPRPVHHHFHHQHHHLFLLHPYSTFQHMSTITKLSPEVINITIILHHLLGANARIQRECTYMNSTKGRSRDNWRSREPTGKARMGLELQLI